MDPEVKKLYITLLSKKNSEFTNIISIDTPRVDYFLTRDGLPIYRYHINIKCGFLREYNAGEFKGRSPVKWTEEIALGADYEPDESQSKRDLLRTLGK